MKPRPVTMWSELPALGVLLVILFILAALLGLADGIDAALLGAL